VNRARSVTNSVIARLVGSVAILRPYSKMIAGFLTPGVVAIGYAIINPSSPGGHAVTSGEWHSALALMLTTAGIVWKVENKT
jgi:hypothetical protein